MSTGDVPAVASALADALKVMSGWLELERIEDRPKLATSVPPMLRRISRVLVATPSTARDRLNGIPK